MKYYIELLDKDEIVFLKDKPEKKQLIKNLVMDMLTEETMNGKIAVACKLWKALFDASLSYISPNKQGYDKIFNYFDAYVEFEELIFASDSFYRDHTLHCIWVYFLGEYIYKNDKFAQLRADLTLNKVLFEGAYRMVEGTESLSKKSERTIKGVRKILSLSEENFDVAFCLEAITHDLGYPLKKIEKINKSIKKGFTFLCNQQF